MLLPQILNKIRQERARVPLIAPNWPQSHWFADLKEGQPLFFSGRQHVLAPQPRSFAVVTVAPECNRHVAARLFSSVINTVSYGSIHTDPVFLQVSGGCTVVLVVSAVAPCCITVILLNRSINCVQLDWPCYHWIRRLHIKFSTAITVLYTVHSTAVTFATSLLLPSHRSSWQPGTS